MLETLISTSVLIVILAILRFVLRDRISARLQYALWLLALVRLLVPVSFFQSPVSVAEAAKPVTERAEALDGAIVFFSQAPVSAVYTTPDNEMLVIQDAVPNIAADRVFALADIARYVWYAGIAVMGMWFLFVNLRMGRRLKKTRTPYAEEHDPPVYAAEDIPSPCLFGLLHPAIYLTEQAASDPIQARQIVAHEKTHLHHGDLVWALLRSVCLAVWWFNPFVWLAAALSRQDCELACDEGTIRALGEDERFDYGRTLVGMAHVGARASDLLCGATTMTSGRKTLKKRVERIANAPKASVVIAVAAVIIAAIAVGCTYGGPAAEPEPDTPNEPVPAIMVGGELYVSTGRILAGDIDPAGFVGAISSVVPASEWPTEEGQANFGEIGDPYAITEFGLTVMEGLEWTPFAAADGDSEKTPDPDAFETTPPSLRKDGVASAEVFASGRSAELTGAGELSALLDVMDGIAFTRLEQVGEAYAPGSISVTVTLRYEDGGEALWTYPVMFYHGAAFSCDAQSITLFAPFLGDAGAGDELAAAASWEPAILYTADDPVFLYFVEYLSDGVTSEDSEAWADYVYFWDDESREMALRDRFPMASAVITGYQKLSGDLWAFTVAYQDYPGAEAYTAVNFCGRYDGRIYVFRSENSLPDEFVGALDDLTLTADVGENVMQNDEGYWAEVRKELASFCEPESVELDISEGFARDADAIGQPLTPEDYIFGTDSWIFEYDSEFIAADHEPYAWIRLYDAEGRALWIMDDADALMIEEADGSVTRVTLPGGLDTADMINHLILWAQEEYGYDNIHRDELASTEADTQAALAALGDYGLAGREAAFVVGSDDAFTLADALTGQAGSPVTGVTRLYGMEGPELYYERYYADETRTESITADVFAEMSEEYRSRSTEYRDVTVNGNEALACVMGAPYLIWYDAERDVIFTMLCHGNADGKLDQPLLDDMLALAGTVE